MHYGEDDKVDENNEKLQNSILKADRPDFTAVTGDCVSGWMYDGIPGWYKKQWDKWTRPYLQNKVPYALAMGNHDDQADANRNQILSYELTHPYSMSKIGPKSITGITNYYIPVYSSNKTSDEIEFLLWFFDSMDHNCYSDKSWGCVGNDTVQWYRDESERLVKEYKRIIPGIAFVHIPPPEYLEATRTNKINGTKEEDVCCPIYNTGLIGAMIDNRNVQAMFVGHDHDNDYSVDVDKKIYLYYGRKTGYGCYGPISVQHGSRIIRLNERSHSYDTWIRNEDGTITNYTDPVDAPKQDTCSAS